MNKLPKDVMSYVLDFVIDPEMKLVDWLIPYESKLLDSKITRDIFRLLENDSKFNTFSRGNQVLSYIPQARNLIKNQKNKIDWEFFAANTEDLEFLENNLEKVKKTHLLKNNNIYKSKILMEFVLNNINDYEYSIISRTKEGFMYLYKNKPEYINWTGGCIIRDKEVLDIIEKNLDKIESVNSLSSNPEAIHIIKNNLDKIDFTDLSCNPNPEVINILSDKIEKIDWEMLQNFNRSAVEITKKYPDRIDWELLCMSKHHEAIELLKNNLDKVDWDIISENQKAYEIIKDNLDKVNWKRLSENPSDEVVDILFKNKDKIDWSNFCANLNPRVIELIKENIDKIDWFTLTLNPNIFEIDIKETLKKKNLFMSSNNF